MNMHEDFIQTLFPQPLKPFFCGRNGLLFGNTPDMFRVKQIDDILIRLYRKGRNRVPGERTLHIGYDPQHLMDCTVHLFHLLFIPAS